MWQELWDLSASICACLGESFVLGNVSCGFLAGCVWPGCKDSSVPSWVAFPWHSPVPPCFHSVGLCHEHELPSATGAEKLFKPRLELKLDKESALPHHHKIN